MIRILVSLLAFALISGCANQTTGGGEASPTPVVASATPSTPTPAATPKTFEQTENPMSMPKDFHDALFRGKNETIEEMVKENPDLVNSRFVGSGMSGPGAPALQVTCGRGNNKEGKLATVEFLIANGANIHDKDKYGGTAFNATGANDEILKLLIEKGADVNNKARSGETVLYWAATYGKMSTLQLLVDNGADVNIATDKGVTALHRAAGAGKAEAVEYLISKGADVNAKDNEGNSVLSVTKSEKLKALLKEAGATE